MTKNKNHISHLSQKFSAFPSGIQNIIAEGGGGSVIRLQKHFFFLLTHY